MTVRTGTFALGLAAFALAACGAYASSGAPSSSISSSPPANASVGPTAPLAVRSPVIPVVLAFGQALDSTVQLVKPADTFKTTTATIAWLATFSPQLQPGLTTLTIAAVGSDGATLYTQDYTYVQPLDRVGDSGDYAALIGRRPGTYVMRLLQHNTVIAEGQFTLK